MGDPVLPMWSGVLEMVLRTATISLLIDKMGFRAAAFAEICAWLGALIINVYAFGRIIIPKLSKEKGTTHIALQELFFTKKKSGCHNY